MSLLFQVAVAVVKLDHQAPLLELEEAVVVAVVV